MRWCVAAKPKPSPCVGAAGAPADGGAVAVGDHVFDVDVHVRRRGEEHLAYLAKAFRTAILAAFDVADRVGSHELVDQVVAAFAPDLFEPTAPDDSGFRFMFHERS
jgi:hypothetical protein